jgi:xanthine/uracil permease
MSDDEPPSHPQRALIGLVAVLAMIAGVVFVMYKLHQASALQDCLASGRTNCMQITTHQQ